MLPGLGNVGALLDALRHFGRLRSEAGRVLAELKDVVVEGSSGGGMVKARMNGKMELLDCKIDPQVFADRDAELLEDLIVAAVNQAIEKSRAAAAEKLSQAAEGLNIPGLSEALTELGGGKSGS